MTSRSHRFVLFLDDISRYWNARNVTSDGWISTYIDTVEGTWLPEYMITVLSSNITTIYKSRSRPYDSASELIAGSASVALAGQNGKEKRKQKKKPLQYLEPASIPPAPPNSLQQQDI